MIIPGSNLLGLAGKLIAFQSGKHWRNRGVIDGNDGINSPAYYPPEPIVGSLQAVPRSAYESNGLDVQREYITFYTSTKLQDTRRDKTPDMIDYGGDRYVVESNTDWRNQDGWAGSICVRAGVAT